MNKTIRKFDSFMLKVSDEWFDEKVSYYSLYTTNFRKYTYTRSVIMQTIVDLIAACYEYNDVLLKAIEGVYTNNWKCAFCIHKHYTPFKSRVRSICGTPKPLRHHMAHVNWYVKVPDYINNPFFKHVKGAV